MIGRLEYQSHYHPEQYISCTQELEELSCCMQSGPLSAHSQLILLCVHTGTTLAGVYFPVHYYNGFYWLLDF